MRNKTKYKYPQVKSARDLHDYVCRCIPVRKGREARQIKLTKGGGKDEERNDIILSEEQFLKKRKKSNLEFLK